MLGYDLDTLIFSEKRFWRLAQASVETGLSENELLSQVAAWNEKLAAHKQRQIEQQADRLAFPEKILNLEAVRYDCVPSQLSLHDGTRQALIILLTFADRHLLAVSDFEDLLFVSRNTVLADIKKVRELLAQRRLELVYSRKAGFTLDGDELRVRAVAWWALQQLHEPHYYVLSHFLNADQSLCLAAVQRRLRSSLVALGLQIVYSRFLPALFFTTLLTIRQARHPLTVALPQLIETTTLDFLSVSQVERGYLLALLIGSSDRAYPDSRLDFLYRIGFQIMENVMKLTAIDFDDFTKTFLALLDHLTPAYFRLLYHFEIENPLLERVCSEYGELFSLMERALEPLTQLVGSISEPERAYFVILFGGEIYKRRHGPPLRALVLCANGISSSLIMKKRLEQLFPAIPFISASSISQLEEISPSRYEMIFSTLPVSTTKKVYLMSPFPDYAEEAALYNQVMRDFHLPGFIRPTAQSILSAISPYLAAKSDKKKVLQVIDKKLKKQNPEMKEGALMLSDLLTKDNVRFTDRQLNWEEAITLAARPLLDGGSIAPSYVTAVINRVREFGPYIDLGSGIALPHARPEEGVNKVGMALLRVRKPVQLLNDSAHTIQLFIVLAAVDNESHLHALSELTQILSDKDKLNKLLAATRVEEIEKIIKK